MRDHSWVLWLKLPVLSTKDAPNIFFCASSLTIGRTEFILTQACPLNFVVEHKCPGSLLLPVGPLPQCCVMTGGPGREKRGDEHNRALLETGGQPELYFSPWLFSLSSRTPSLIVPTTFSHLGIFQREGFTANQNHCSMLAFFELWAEKYGLRSVFYNSGIPCHAPQVHPD